TYVAAHIYLQELYRKAAANRKYDQAERYGSFYQLITELTDMGIYSTQLLDTYSVEEINELGLAIDYTKDSLFTYIGLLTLA
ncbi:hypothetical protein KZ287_32595, partial [Escherichia coli]|nr:hypothetical protein [Escherichia coli]